MPVGPYKTFSDCVTALQNKGKSADSAKNICGAMEKQSQSQASLNSTVTTNPHGKLFVKAFLIDDTTNLNKWAVTKDSIPKHINTFIGKPLVLTQNYDHPAVPETERLSHWLAYQEVFRVGTIIDIVPKMDPLTLGTAYHAIIEITNDNLKQSLRDNSVPLYVSPAIAQPAFSKTGGLVSTGPDESISEWTGVHLAIVDQPAFGIRRAVINEQCGGDEKGCLLQLRKAHIAQFGQDNCGFCVKKALNRLQILYTASLSNQAKQPSQIDTSQITKTTEDKRKHLSQLESIPNAVSSENSEQNQQTQQPQQTQSQPQPQQETQFMVNKQPINVPSTTNITDLVQINQRLLQENELLKIKNEELSNVKDTLSERIGALEMQSRKEKISQIITSEVIKDDKTRLEKIKYFVGTTIPIEQIEELYNGFKVTLRKANISNMNRGIGKVPYYASNSAFGSGSIISSNPPGGSNQPQVDENGLTPLQKQLAALEGGL